MLTAISALFLTVLAAVGTGAFIIATASAILFIGTALIAAPPFGVILAVIFAALTYGAYNVVEPTFTESTTTTTEVSQ